MMLDIGSFSVGDVLCIEDVSFIFAVIIASSGCGFLLASRSARIMAVANSSALSHFFRSFKVRAAIGGRNVV